MRRGGNWGFNFVNVQSSARDDIRPDGTTNTTGFRVASVELIEIPPVPEPSSTALLGLGGLGGLALMLRRRM